MLPDRWNTQRAAEIFDDPFVEPVMLVPDLDIGPGRPCGLWSAPGAGKNVTAQAIAVSVATGRKVFGRLAASHGRVLHITYDYGAMATKLRYRQLANGLGVEAGELAGRLELAPFPTLNLASPEALEAFTLKFDGFDLVVLDNLRSATGSADENASTFGTYVQILGTASEKTGATTLYLHHTKKSDDGRVDTNSGRGSGAILGASGSVWGIEVGDNESRKLVHIRAHDMAELMCEPMWLTLVPGEHGSFDTGTHTRALTLTAHDDNPAAASKRKRDEQDQNAQALRAIQEHPGIGAAELRKESGLVDKMADAAVARLLKSGAVVDRGTGAPRAPRSYYPADVGSALAA